MTCSYQWTDRARIYFRPWTLARLQIPATITHLRIAQHLGTMVTTQYTESQGIIQDRRTAPLVDALRVSGK